MMLLVHLPVFLMVTVMIESWILILTVYMFSRKAIKCFLELTKASNVQNTNVGERALKREALIDLTDNMIKQLSVKCFSQCISGSTGLFWLQWHSVKKRNKQNAC